MSDARNDLHAYTVHALAKDQHRWRIDWFGAVTYAERHLRPSQPLIEIQLSQVSETLADALDLFSPSPDPRPITKQIRLPVGFLPMLAVGDIWQNGKFVESPNYDLARFDLLVNRRDVTLIKAGLPDEDCGEYYLPSSQHPYHMQHTQSYCVRIKSGSSIVIIPAIELLRFYFGSSSTMISRLFDAPLADANFWSAIDDKDSDTPRIHLATGISGRSASDIGRIAFNKIARASAELIGNSCIIATTNGERAYPKAAFPFEGVTNLSASGKWLSFSGMDKGVFLVFRLLSCSHPFPFKKLRYTSEQACNSSSDIQRKAFDAEDAKERKTLYSKRQGDAKILDDDEPFKTKTARALRFFFGTVKFPDLAGKSITKVEDEIVPTLLLSKKGLSTIRSSSVGEAGTDSSIQPIELALSAGGTSSVSSRAKEHPATVAVFFKILEKLRLSNSYITVDTVRLSQRQRFDFLSVMPQMIDDDGEVSSCCIVFEKSAEGEKSIVTRNRRISIARAESLYSTSYFIIPELLNELDKIELHVIRDVARSIRTIPDLMTAIATHLTLEGVFNRKYELNSGVSSASFVQIEFSNSTQQTADELLSKALKFFANISIKQIES